MGNQFDIQKYAFIEAGLSNIPPTEKDMKKWEDEAAYLKEIGKRKVLCCCIDTRKLLEKLYDFQGFITKLDFDIFTKSLIQHPFDRFNSKEDLLKGIIEIKDRADYISHSDIKAYFLACLRNEVIVATTYMGRGRMGDPTAKPYFEKKWNELIIESEYVDTVELIPPSVVESPNTEFKHVSKPDTGTITNVNGNNNTILQTINTTIINQSHSGSGDNLQDSFK